MRDSQESLERECTALARYLVGADPTDYVLAKYVAAHDAVDAVSADGRFDELLVRLARGPALLRLPAAAVARLHGAESALQNKLVLLLAILESTPPTAGIIDAAPSHGRVGLGLRAGVRVMIATLALMVGTVLLIPIRWMWARRDP